jgi:hypothetical protein
MARRVAGHWPNSNKKRLSLIQRAEGAGVTVSAPVTQRRGVDTFTAQDRIDPSGLCRAIGRRQATQLDAAGERSPPGPAR